MSGIIAAPPALRPPRLPHTPAPSPPTAASPPTAPSPPTAASPPTAPSPPTAASPPTAPSPPTAASPSPSSSRSALSRRLAGRRPPLPPAAARPMAEGTTFPGARRASSTSARWRLSSADAAAPVPVRHGVADDPVGGPALGLGRHHDGDEGQHGPVLERLQHLDQRRVARHQGQGPQELPVRPGWPPAGPAAPARRSPAPAPGPAPPVGPRHAVRRPARRPRAPAGPAPPRSRRSGRGPPARAGDERPRCACSSTSPRPARLRSASRTGSRDTPERLRHRLGDDVLAGPQAQPEDLRVEQVEDALLDGGGHGGTAGRRHDPSIRHGRESPLILSAS